MSQYKPPFKTSRLALKWGTYCSQSLHRFQVIWGCTLQTRDIIVYTSQHLPVYQPISSATNHENTAFKARPNTSRESGSFSCSELFISTNHCTARGIVSTSDPWISTKSAAISLFMLRFAWNSELKLLSPSPFEPRGRFWVLFVRLFVILDTASWICCHFFVYGPICMKFKT